MNINNNNSNNNKIDILKEISEKIKNATKKEVYCLEMATMMI